MNKNDLTRSFICIIPWPLQISSYQESLLKAIPQFLQAQNLKKEF